MSHALLRSGMTGGRHTKDERDLLIEYTTKRGTIILLVSYLFVRNHCFCLTLMLVLLVENFYKE